MNDLTLCQMALPHILSALDLREYAFARSSYRVTRLSVKNKEKQWKNHTYALNMQVCRLCRVQPVLKLLVTTNPPAGTRVLLPLE